ncbi:Response regulator transcription factor [Sulfidibacter corallicola]|uniref:Response regulator transcription factor n=1 Tax=Sulfidibacter corallicola TaxID=2818388 RepID=A0A8A4TIW3_SULCO|nr:LytTR family DNA-binding domain-containing protein [Sulfidibacter corallicola]QTD49543.1 response regulator transcription factor [Sulfidibacter corallicola]
MHVLIVEDETMIAARLERLLLDIAGNTMTSLRIAPNLAEAESLIQRQRPDLLFLDLNLKGRDGFELLRKAAAGAFHTVVVSAHTERALEAFEYGVLDFVAKPFGRERLERAVQRFRETGSRAEHATRFIAIKKAGGVSLVPLTEVAYIRGADNYAELVLRDGTTHLHHKSLDRLLKLLPAHWQRIHKSYLANLDEARSWHRSEGSKYEVELVDGTRLPVGRTRYKALRATWL